MRYLCHCRAINYRGPSTLRDVRLKTRPPQGERVLLLLLTVRRKKSRLN
jgi:hypothetical protein